MIYAKIIETAQNNPTTFCYKFLGSPDEIEKFKTKFYKNKHSLVPEEYEVPTIEVIHTELARMGFTPISETFFYKES